MPDIISAEEIADIQDQIAPAEGDEMSEMVEVWDFPTLAAATPAPAGGVGVDEGGFPVEEGADPERPDQSRAKLAEYPAQIVGGWQGTEQEFGAQQVNASRYTLFFNAADNPQIRGGARILVKETEWSASTPVAVGDLVQPTTSNGRFYRAKAAGTTGESEPTWTKPEYPSTTAADVSDGGVTWEYAGYLRSFEVKLPGGAVTYEVLRRVLCEEIVK